MKRVLRPVLRCNELPCPCGARVRGWVSAKASGSINPARHMKVREKRKITARGSATNGTRKVQGNLEKASRLSTLRTFQTQYSALAEI